MAYMSQENKKSKAPAIKAILKKYGLKGTLAVRHHSTLILNISEGKIDFIKNYNDKAISDNPCQVYGMQQTTQYEYLQVNSYWFRDHFTGAAKDCLEELLGVMDKGNHDNSDAMTDYFDIGWYVDINIGQWDKPYKVLN